jgi:hypothetical protein
MGLIACPGCSSQIEVDARFCPKCGRPIGEASAVGASAEAAAKRSVPLRLGPLNKAGAVVAVGGIGVLLAGLWGFGFLVTAVGLVMLIPSKSLVVRVGSGIFGALAVCFVLSVVSGGSKAKKQPESAQPPVASSSATVATQPPAPTPPPRPASLRDALLAQLTTGINGCVEFDPAIQVHSDGVARVQYVHGCGQFEKADVGQTMWMVLVHAVAAAKAAEVAMPTFRIEAFTRNGSGVFTSIVTPKDIERLINKEMGFDDWLVHVAEGPRKLVRTAAQAAYLQALPDVAADVAAPAGDDMKADLSAYIEDLPCAKDVSKLTLGKTVALGYREVCGHFEAPDVHLTEYEVARRIIAQYKKRHVWSALDIYARAENGGDVFRLTVPGRVLKGIDDRQVGIVDWLTQKY